MAAERSRAIQSALQRIDADRAGWVSNFVAEWGRVLDPRVYDVYRDLTPIAMKAPAWQLYAASLVGDYHSMLDVLRGYRSAGRVVNRLAAPERRARPASAGRTLAFGDTTEQLVYTPVAPCRVVDTRPGNDGPGARTGVLAAGAARTFDFTTAAFTSGQGGGPSSVCTGLPSSNVAAWAFNLTVVGSFTAQGGLKAWGFSGLEPNSSVINWQAGQNGAIANGAIVPGCYGCADDITIRAFGDSTNIIVDVVGYFRQPTIQDATITRFIGPDTVLPAGGTAVAVSGVCPAGTLLVGGETDDTGTNVALGEFRQLSATQWTAEFRNNEGISHIGTVTARCLDTPIIIP